MSGTEANHGGDFLEENIEREFSRRSVPAFQHSEEGSNGDMFHRCRLIKNAPYRSLYGCQARSEFLYVHMNIPLVRIECRFQASAGSVDEKFPYFFLNARDAMPEDFIWLVVDGGGARQEALTWLRQQAAKESKKAIVVMTLFEAKAAIKPLVEHGRATPLRPEVA